MNRPITTLFMISSLDGKISTGKVDARDVDKDFPRIPGLKEGLSQYYELEKQTDSCSLNTGKVMAKIGVNSANSPINCPNVTFVIIDNKHLTENGVLNLSNHLKKLILVTSYPLHPAFKIKKDNLEIVFYDKSIDFTDLFSKLKTDHLVDHLTIQSGGTLNSVLLRLKLIDKLSLVVAPALIGGANTPTLVDGSDLQTLADLDNIQTLTLEEVTQLNNSYLHLQYSLNNN